MYSALMASLSSIGGRYGAIPLALRSARTLFCKKKHIFVLLKPYFN